MAASMPGNARTSRMPLFMAGVLGIVLASGAGALFAQARTAPRVTAGTTRTYYIAADEVDWNYMPADHDLMSGGAYDARARLFYEKAPNRIGSTYRKAIYREYTDATFATLKPRPAAWEHLGILGPIIRGEVGDTIKVVFRNNARFPFSVHAHGVRYEEESAGVTPVATGATFTYTWRVDPRSGPKAGEPSSKLWLYHSHVNEQRDVAAGLMGAIIVSARGTTKPDGTPKDVDREFVGILYTLDEQQSLYLDQNIATYISNPAGLQKNLAVFQDINGQPVNVGFAATNFRETINGYQFGNLPGVTMKQGERVRWYTAGMAGAHTFHWHGNTVLLDQISVDVVPLSAAEMHTTDMVAETPGMWMLHCHVEGHLAIGMWGHYIVEGAQAAGHVH